MNENVATITSKQIRKCLLARRRAFTVVGLFIHEGKNYLATDPEPPLGGGPKYKLVELKENERVFSDSDVRKIWRSMLDDSEESPMFLTLGELQKLEDDFLMPFGFDRTP